MFGSRGIDSLGLTKVIRILSANNYSRMGALDVLVKMDKVFSVKCQKHSIFSRGKSEDVSSGIACRDLPASCDVKTSCPSCLSASTVPWGKFSFE